MKNRRLNTLTRGDIEKAAQNLQPNPARAWVVDVGGKRFPVRQLVQESANRLRMPSVPLVTPLDNCTSHQAVRLLRAMGFDVHYLRT